MTRARETPTARASSAREEYLPSASACCHSRARMRPLRRSLCLGRAECAGSHSGGGVPSMWYAKRVALSGADRTVPAKIGKLKEVRDFPSSGSRFPQIPNFRQTGQHSRGSAGSGVGRGGSARGITGCGFLLRRPSPLAPSAYAF